MIYLHVPYNRTTHANHMYYWIEILITELNERLQEFDVLQSQPTSQLQHNYNTTVAVNKYI